MFTEPPFRGAGTSLRRAVTALLPDEPLLHNHTDGPRLPRIRYVCRDGIPELVAIEEGIPLLAGIEPWMKELRVGDDVYVVRSTEQVDERLPFGECAARVTYRSTSPWLALNEQNFHRYAIASIEQRRALLARILVGNLLSLAKSVGHRVRERIDARVLMWTDSSAQHKGVSMVAIDVVFDVNFDIPPGLGIGKLSSKGFGQVEVLGRREAVDAARHHDERCVRA